MKRLLLVGGVFLLNQLLAQDSTRPVVPVASPLALSGYLETYYSYDFGEPTTHTRPSFLYNFNRHNEFNLNLVFIKAAYVTDRVRANIAVAAGTYMNANYTAEPGTLKNVFEANVGYKLSATKQVWLDVGVMPSHIGFESAIGKDNWNLTRSVVAENSPYFESGAKLSYVTTNGKWTLAALVLNGWQNITRVNGNSLLSYGTQIYYKPSDHLTLNYSTFIGTLLPDSIHQWRYYHNVYSIFRLSNKVGLVTGFDIGMQQTALHSSKLNTWYTPVIIVRLSPATHWAFAVRGEYYSDAHNVIISTGTPDGFKTGSTSLNIDYLPQKNVALRVEGRLFFSEVPIFTRQNRPATTNAAVTCSAAISL